MPKPDADGFDRVVFFVSPTGVEPGDYALNVAVAGATFALGLFAAMPAFAALVGLHADDALAGFHLRRLLNGGKGVRMQLE